MIKKLQIQLFVVLILIVQNSFSQDTIEKAKLPKLFIESFPDSASIFFNDSTKTSGLTPWRMKSNPLKISVQKVTLKKHMYIDTSFYAKFGIDKLISIRLIKISKIITISSLFSGHELNADIYLDKKRIGITPLTGKFEYGNYNFTLKKNGFLSKSFSYLVEDTVSVTKNILLEKPFYYGNLEVRTIPENANLYINNKYYGKTPLTIANLPIGMYNVTVNKNIFFRTVKDTIIVNKDSTSTVNFTLEKKGISLNYPFSKIVKYNKNKIEFHWSKISCDASTNIAYRLIVSDRHDFTTTLIDTIVNTNELKWQGELLKWDSTYYWKLLVRDNYNNEIQSDVLNFVISKPKIIFEPQCIVLNYLNIKNDGIVSDKKILKGFEDILYLNTFHAVNFLSLDFYPIFIRYDLNPILILNNSFNKKYFDGLGFNTKIYISTIYKIQGIKPSLISGFDFYNYGFGIYKKDYKICRIINGFNFSSKIFNIDLAITKIYMPYEFNSSDSYRKNIIDTYTSFCYQYTLSFFKNVHPDYNIILRYSYLKSFSNDYSEQEFSIGLMKHLNFNLTK